MGVKCPECKTLYEFALGGPVAFICKNPECELFDRVGIAEAYNVNPNDYAWLGINRDLKG